MNVRRFVPARVFPFIAVAVIAPAAFGQQPAPADRPEDPEVSLTIRNEGQAHRQVINFSATPGSFVVLIRVNPAGVVDVLHPATPSLERSLVRSEKSVRVSSLSNPKAFYSHGTVFAFVSRNPFDFSKVSGKSGWNSLHLRSYSGISAETIARTFGDEISLPWSRVIMTDPMYSGAVAGTKSGESLTWLTTFRNKECPTLATITYSGSSGRAECSIQGFRVPGAQPSRSLQTTPNRNLTNGKSSQ